MKRTVLILTAAAVAITPLAASAATPKPTKRTITFDYDGPSAIGTPAFSLNASGVAPVCEAYAGCWDFTTVKGEKTIEISAGDPGLGFQVWHSGTYADTVTTFCGKGKVTVSPKKATEVFVRPALDDCGGLNTGGTLTAVITGTK